MSHDSPPGERRRRLLIVDDEPLNRDLLRRVLKVDYDCEEAEDAETAVAVLEASARFDCVLCDQLMPGRLGTELAVEVRRRWPAVLFLLITGYDDDAQVRDAMANGSVHKVVTKPWTARGLKALLASLLA